MIYHKVNSCVVLAYVMTMLFSCTQKPEAYPPFEDRVMLLENNPELFLARMDTADLSSDITTNKGATDFLLKTMAQNFLGVKCSAVKERLVQCEALFKNSREVYKQLETLNLLAKIYNEDKNHELEVITVNRALKLAMEEECSKWMLHLYCYLSDMYIRDMNVLKYIEYQTLASEILTGEDVNHANVRIRMSVGKNYLYSKQYDKAVDLLLQINHSISEKHAYYSECLCLLGVAYFKSGQWDSCIKTITEVLNVVSDDDHKFVCYSMLTFCYYYKQEVVSARKYRDLAIKYDCSDETSHLEIEFYKMCADFAKDNSNIQGEIDCLRKVIDHYEQKVKKLNKKTLDEAVQAYTRMCEKNRYEQELRKYQFIAFFFVVALLGGCIAYIDRKKRQACRLLALQQQILELESLEHIKKEIKIMILRDMEVAKRVATMKQTQQERGNRLLKEMDKLSLLDGNKLFNTKWNDFYRQIDIVFDNFHYKLVEKYPTLNDKEKQLCCLLIAGFRTEEIAAVWEQSVYTVHKCKTNVRKKINAPEGADIQTFLMTELS